MPMNLMKPNLKRVDGAKELETVDKPFLQVDRLDDEGDKVEAEVEGGEVEEGSHQQRLDLGGFDVKLQCERNIDRRNLSQGEPSQIGRHVLPGNLRMVMKVMAIMIVGRPLSCFKTWLASSR